MTQIWLKDEDFGDVLNTRHRWLRLRPHISHAISAHRVHPRQQEFSDTAQDLGDRHFFAEQQVREVRSLHVLVQVHLVMDLLHFFVHQPFSYGRRQEGEKQKPFTFANRWQKKRAVMALCSDFTPDFVPSGESLESSPWNYTMM